MRYLRIKYNDGGKNNMSREKITFNKFHGIKDDSYVDINLEKDMLLFIDPSRLKLVDNSNFNAVKADLKVKNYYKEAIDSYRNGYKEKALQLIGHDGELSQLGFGYSQHDLNGNGATPKMLDKVFQKIVESPKILEDGLTSEGIIFHLFTDNFGPDRFSDLNGSIIKQELVKFTQSIVKKYGLEVTEVNLGKGYNMESKRWETITADLPIGLNGKGVLLCPKEIAVESYDHSIEKYMSIAIYPRLKTYHFNAGTPGLRNFNRKQEPTEATNEMIKDYEIRGQYTFKEFALTYTLDNPWILPDYLKKLDRKIK